VGAKVKAYGFLLISQTEYRMGEHHPQCVYGECYAEDGKFLGGWTSSSISFLRLDLAKHAEGYDYVFETDIDKLPEAIRDGLSKRFPKEGNIRG
jgi:hypothetical protein